MVPASLLVGHGFHAIGLFADADARLAAGYTVLTYKGGCERTPWLAEQVIPYPSLLSSRWGLLPLVGR